MMKTFQVDGKTVRLLPMPDVKSPIWHDNLRWMLYVKRIQNATFKAVQR